MAANTEFIVGSSFLKQNSLTFHPILLLITYLFSLLCRLFIYITFFTSLQVVHIYYLLSRILLGVTNGLFSVSFGILKTEVPELFFYFILRVE
jgi:hypothetical protein